jgi:hypothetical protein
LELLKNICLRSPRLPVLILSMHDESVHAERALRAGANGYILKQEATEGAGGAAPNFVEKFTSVAHRQQHVAALCPRQRTGTVPGRRVDGPRAKVFPDRRRLAEPARSRSCTSARGSRILPGSSKINSAAAPAARSARGPVDSWRKLQVSLWPTIPRPRGQPSRISIFKPRPALVV